MEENGQAISQEKKKLANQHIGNLIKEVKVMPTKDNTIRIHKCLAKNQAQKVMNAINVISAKSSPDESDTRAMKILLEVYDALSNPAKENRKYLSAVDNSVMVKVPTGIMSVSYNKDGKNYLVLAKTDGEKRLWEKRYLVERLVNENLEVTEQTLEQEKKEFVKSSSSM